ncbi:MAG: hypothetical protein LLG00_16410 [Planctomycetaceae bacterium]|nr:hypothetical protein [Planctomycetaceae bacterium]
MAAACIGHRRWRVGLASLLIAALFQPAVAQRAPQPMGRAPGPAAAAPAPTEKPEIADPGEPAPQPDPGCEELPVDRQQKRNYVKVNATLMAGQFSAGLSMSEFDDFYTKFYLAQWTQWENVTKLPDLRGQLRNSHLARKSNSGSQVHDHLNELVLDFMKKLTAGPYYRAVKINAVLMIGQLNSVESPPTPWSEALKVLVAIVGSNKAPDALRAAAMVGILRHAAADNIPQADRELITAAMLRLAAADIGNGKPAAGRQWILGQGLMTLGLLKTPGNGNEAFNVLVATLANSKLTLCTRSIAADSIGRLSLAGASGIDATEAGAALGQLAMDACTTEIKSLKPDSVAIDRDRIKQRLDAVLAGAKAIVSLAKDPAQQAWITELGKITKSVGDMLDDPRMRDKDKEVKAAVEGLPAKVSAWLQKRPK